MASYFDIMPKELFIIILNKLNKHIFDGINVAYLRHVNIFNDENFWKKLIKVHNPDILELPVTAVGSYFWMNVYKTISNVSFDKLVKNQVTSDDLVSLYLIRKYYPNYYDIYKDMDLCCYGIDPNFSINWTDIHGLTMAYGEYSYKQFNHNRYYVRNTFVKSYPRFHVIFKYLQVCIRKKLDKNYAGNISCILMCAIFNYSMYDRIMMSLQVNKKILQDTLIIIDDHDVIDLEVRELLSDVHIEEARRIVKDDFNYRISLL